MVEQDLINLLMNGGSNAAFGLFLWWQYKEQQKRADDREAKQEVKERELRERYDKVIEGYQTKETQTRESITKEVQDIDKRLAILEQKVDRMNDSIDEINQKFLRIS
jgi:hypothetical protein